MGERTRLLWIDDRITSSFEAAVVARLTQRGFEVAEATSSRDGMERLDRESADAVILDLNMSPKNGLGTARDVLVRRPRMPLVFFSAYLQEFGDLQRRLSPLAPTRSVEKPTESGSVERAADELVEAVNSVIRQGDPSENRLAEVTADSAFSVDIETYRSFDATARSEWSRRAADEARPYTTLVFQETSCAWVMLCADPVRVLAHSNSFKDVPTPASIENMANVEGYPPLVCSRPLVVDDLSWNSCGAESDDFYPTVWLDFGRADQELIAHFDTGNPRTVISYEWLRERGIITETPFWNAGTRYPNLHFNWARYEIEGELRDGGVSPTIRVFCDAVEQWRGGPYDRLCEWGRCTGSVPSEQPRRWHCGNRDALFGRNLLTDNSLRLILDGKSRTTRIG